MSLRILKFGGSNLREPADLDICAEITAGYEAPCIIVVSAFYGVTDKLEKAAKEASEKGVSPESFIEEFSSLCYGWLGAEPFPGKNRETIKPAGSGGKNTEDSTDQFVARKNGEVLSGPGDMLERLSRLLRGVHAIGELPPAIYDNILSFGERISAYIVAEALRARNMNALLALPEEFGLITSSDYGNAGVLLDDSLSGVRKHFDGENYFVVPGFYGVSHEGKITLLGRGGTDYSAASLAYLLDAASLDIWKDVDGFRTADPGFVNGSSTIGYLSYNEAAELSYFGAKILHPRTVEPLQKKKIPLRIFNVRSPGKGARSVIGPGKGDELSGPKSITFSRNFSVIKFSGAGVGSKPGVLAGIAGIMDSAGVNISSVFTSQTAICFLLQNKELQKAERALKKGHPELISNVDTVSGIALIALVGEGITRKRGVAARVFNAVAEENINVEIISAGASASAVYFMVREDDCERAVEAAHRFFFSDMNKAGWHLIQTL